MNTRVRLAVILAQVFLIIPLFLIPFTYSYNAIVVLRFIQGLWFMELGLATLNLRGGWFSKGELAIAMQPRYQHYSSGQPLVDLLRKPLPSRLVGGWRF